MNAIKFLTLSFLISFFTLSLNANSNNYPFQSEVTGTGDKVILFIPGFGNSGEV